MRMPIFLLRASCRLFAATFITCLITNTAFSQQIADSSAHGRFPTASKLRSSAKATPATYIGGKNKRPNTVIQVIESPDLMDDPASLTKYGEEADSLDKEAVASDNAAALDVLMKRIPGFSKHTDSIFKVSGARLDAGTDLLIHKYAEMIATTPEEVGNYSLYRFIDQWYGTRYKWGGSDNTGIDCSAFSQKLYGAIYGVNILRTARQQRHSSELIKDYEEANEGDLVFFRIRRLRVSHVGIYLANGYFVHASRSHGVVISNLEDRYWQRRYAGCGHIEREEKMSESDYLP
jgi:hypothetical protein